MWRFRGRLARTPLQDYLDVNGSSAELKDSTTGKYSNPAVQHRPHPTDRDLRSASTTGIDLYAARSHRGDQESKTTCKS